MPAGLIGGMVFLIAPLYSSIGFGGASSYLAVMSLFDVPPMISATIALSLNILVAGIGFINYNGEGYFRPRLLWPFLVTSIPAAFLGGALRVSAPLYKFLLNAVLIYVAIRLIWASKSGALKPIRSTQPKIWLALFASVVLGLVSGIVGVGGGIFLSPLIVLAGWGMPKKQRPLPLHLSCSTRSAGCSGAPSAGHWILAALDSCGSRLA
jgi:hypothetical protein